MADVNKFIDKHIKLNFPNAYEEFTRKRVEEMTYNDRQQLFELIDNVMKDYHFVKKILSNQSDVENYLLAKYPYAINKIFKAFYWYTKLYTSLASRILITCFFATAYNKKNWEDREKRIKLAETFNKVQFANDNKPN